VIGTRSRTARRLDHQSCHQRMDAEIEEADDAAGEQLTPHRRGDAPLQ